MNRKTIADMIFITCTLAASGALFMGFLFAIASHPKVVVDPLPPVAQSHEMMVESARRARVMLNDGRE